MTGRRIYSRFLSLTIIVILLAGTTGLFACAEPSAVAPSPAPVPAPTPAPTPSPQPPPAPAPTPTPAAPSPQVTDNTDGPPIMPDGRPVFPHHYWGQVTTSTGGAAADVEVTAWINGKLCGSAQTDENGQYGSDPLAGLPYYLLVTGRNGNVIEFRIDGVTAEEICLGVLKEEDGKYSWQWQNLEPEWQATFVSGEVNGLYLICTQ